jgi:saccharopine dehydrogenase (NAD+, L-lysine-forming)
MDGGVLVVGGTGNVGSRIAANLSRRLHGRIIVAGRRSERAAALAARLGEGVRARTVDVADGATYASATEAVDLVIVCIDLPDAAFARHCLERGIHYVDITAEYETMCQILALDALARRNGATALVGVGLVPGLSNLMAKRGVSAMQGATRVENAFLVGLGEEHGMASLIWTFGHFGDEGYRDRSKFDFRAPYGERTVLHYPFPDQYTLPRTLPIESATSWLCMDSAPMTRLFGLVRRLGLSALFRNASFLDLFARLGTKLRFGGEDCVVTTRVVGPGGTYQSWLKGRGEGFVTALAAVQAAHRLATTSFASGVYHIEQVFRLDDFLPALENGGVSFEESSPSDSPGRPR